MDILDIVLLSVALAMDCFTVSIVSGVILRRWEWPPILQMSVLFGVFQAVMPLIGWLATSHFAAYLEAVDHWIAFGLLAFLGVKMIRESFLPEEEQTFDPHRLATQLLLAVATSIDALAVGISFAATGYDRLSTLLWPLLSIGFFSLLFSLVGHWLGIRFGRSVSRRLRPSLVGGVILLIIGIRVLLTHLL